jgi:RNA polymerase sigma factor (sigma-70 family)
MATYHPEWTEEFRSAAFLALVEAAQCFDLARNIDFSTYARHRIWGALRDSRRKFLNEGKRRHCSRPRDTIRLISMAEGHGRVLNATPDDPVGTDLETLDEVEDCLRQLPQGHSVAFRHLYLEGRSQEEAATLVGCSAAKICRMHSQGLSWLKQSHARSGEQPAASSGDLIDACA